MITPNDYAVRPQGPPLHSNHEPPSSHSQTPFLRRTREPPAISTVCDKMIAKVKSDLNKMKKDRAGERFKNEHKRAKKSGAATGWVRIVFLIAAVVSFAVGVVLVFIPGPAFVFFILSGALIATQWWKAAEALDKAELWLRDVWSRAKKKWTAYRKPAGENSSKRAKKKTSAKS